MPESHQLTFKKLLEGGREVQTPETPGSGKNAMFLVMFEVRELARTVLEIPELNKQTYVSIKSNILHFTVLCKKTSLICIV